MEKYISENYEFRKNLINRILGREDLEYRVSDNGQWIPVSKFFYKERQKIQAESGDDSVSMYPEWLIKKVALKQSEVAPDYIANKNYLKILNDEPVKVQNVKPIKTSSRVSVELTVGDKCFVSFGMKRKLFRNYFTSLPAIVESVSTIGGIEYYNVFIHKINKKKNKVDYFGRHMVMNTEVGRTPEEAVQHVAYSQAIY
ncbi:hypothetical protein GC194_05705 [bacterium]|nr:hypothetical protein [bacterium]